MDWVGLAFPLLLAGYFLRTCVRNEARNAALAKDTRQTKAVIINRKNYLGNSPVSREFAYSYRFRVNGQEYEGNSLDPHLQVGDTVDVEYAPANPAYNQMLAN